MFTKAETVIMAGAPLSQEQLAAQVQAVQPTPAEAIGDKFFSMAWEWFETYRTQEFETFQKDGCPEGFSFHTPGWIKEKHSPLQYGLGSCTPHTILQGFFPFPSPPTPHTLPPTPYPSPPTLRHQNG